jgi:hypothetical protein
MGRLRLTQSIVRCPLGKRRAQGLRVAMQLREVLNPMV